MNPLGIFDPELRDSGWLDTQNLIQGWFDEDLINDDAGGIVTPVGIASGEAFGTLSITITISPSGIASAEAFGTPTLVFVVVPTGIASAEAFGTPLISLTVTPTGIASAEAFGSALITLTVSPSGIASSEDFGVLSISTGLFLEPTGISSEEAFGTPALIYGQDIDLSGIQSGEDFGFCTVIVAVIPIPPTPPPPPPYALSVICRYRSCGDVGDFSEYSLQDGSERTANSSSLCVTRTCSVLPDADIYNIQTGNIAPASNAVLSCASRTCPDSGVPDVEIYNLQDALFFNGTPLSFLIQCPTGQVCPPGLFPRVFTYPPGTFYFPIPPAEPCFTNIVLSYLGCQSNITRVLPCGSSPALINAAAQQIIQEAGQQQAECDAEELFARTLGIVLSDLPTWACIDSDFGQIVYGLVQPSAAVPQPSLWVIDQFDFLNNSQPSWMSAAQSSGDVLLLTGSPTAFGPVSFTIQAVAPPPQSGDPYAIGQRTYTVDVIGISTASPLPSADLNQQYDQVIAATGFGSTPIWGWAYGSLPDGLVFNPLFAGSAAITGIPTEEGDFTFAIFVQDGLKQCVKEFDLSVESVVPHSCSSFTAIVWGSPGISTSGAGIASATLLGNSAVYSASAPSSGVFNTASVNFSGTTSYTGPGGLCCVDYNITGLGGNFEIFQDGSPILQTNSYNPGFPPFIPPTPATPSGSIQFTLAAGVASVITIQGLASVFVVPFGTAESASVSAIIGTCP